MDRLQKILSQAGIASRRAVEKMILDGRVTVNGQCVTVLGMKADPAVDEIAVDGKPVHGMERHVYYLLNKPKGYISTAKDERGRRTVLDLLPEVGERIYPVGRLDNNTEGLLLLTNDGALMNALLHPKFEIYKTYIARVKGIPTPETLDKLRDGVMLTDGMTAPAEARMLEIDAARNMARVEISIHEGRNRQVRRMFEANGHDVEALKRIEFAGLTLSGVSRGSHRALTETEVKALCALAGK
jgi:23S rRNA pseudouridine2605 synthase